MKDSIVSAAEGGSLIDFDLPGTGEGAGEYTKEFCTFLTGQGYTGVQRLPGQANLVQGEKAGRTYRFYFQGAGRVAWWAFAQGVMEKGTQTDPDGFRLVLGLKKDGKTRYWWRAVTPGDLEKKRLMLAGEDPTLFRPAFAPMPEKED